MKAVSEIQKAELHLHVDGLINPQILKAIEEAEIPLDIPLEALERVCPVTSMEDWLNRYAELVTPSVHNRADVLLKVLEKHIEYLITSIWSNSKNLIISFSHSDITRWIDTTISAYCGCDDILGDCFKMGSDGLIFIHGNCCNG